MSHCLDRPVWAALTHGHAPVAVGGAQARRYPAEISPFAAAIDDSPESMAALAALAQPGESMLLMQAGEVTVPPRLLMRKQAQAVQMLAEKTALHVTDAQIQLLGVDDAEAMFALADLTKPGPFSLQAQTLGRFWGIKADGQLIAMGGERLNGPGFRELSGLCTHPDHQGQGLGRRLLAFVAAQIAQRGETAFLHAYAANTHAIRLYESVGFRHRCAMTVAVVEAEGL
jgi:predicted GNAT family acetyltransferase